MMIECKKPHAMHAALLLAVVMALAFFAMMADASMLLPEASGKTVFEKSGAYIDASNADQGYVMVKYTGIKKPIVLVVAFALLILALVAAALETFFMIVLPVCVFERRYFFGAVSRAFRLVTRDYARMFGVNLLWLAVSYLFSGFLSLLIQAPLWVLTYVASSPAAVMVSTMANMMLSIAVLLLTAPLSGIFAAAVYMNQRVRHEGLDIEIELERLGETHGSSLAR